MNLKEAIERLKRENPVFMRERNLKLKCGDLEIPWQLVLEGQWSFILEASPEFAEIVTDFMANLREQAPMAVMIEETKGRKISRRRLVKH
jgi:hypothetical protein